MKTHKVVALVTLLVALTSAQLSRTPPTFRLGMSLEEVTRVFGPPTRYLMNGYYYDRYPSVVTGLLWRAYSRSTSQNEYEILVHFRVDSSESRLHPTLRVQEVRFKADKAKTMKEILLDVPEAIVVCANGCHARAEKRLGLAMYLVPVGDAPTATVVGTLSDPDTGEVITPGAKLIVDEISVSESSQKGHQAILDITSDTGVIWKP